VAGSYTTIPGLAKPAPSRRFRRLAIGADFPVVDLSPRQLAYLHRPAGFEVRVAGEQRFGVLDRRRGDPDIAGQVLRDVGRRSALWDADARSDLAAALEHALAVEGLQIGIPRARLFGRRVVMHEENVFRHVHLPAAPHCSKSLLGKAFRRNAAQAPSMG